MNPQLIFRNLPRIFADALITIAGVWSLFTVASVYLKVTFDQFLLYAWLPLLVSIALCIYFVWQYLSTEYESPAVTAELSEFPAPKLHIPIILLIITCLLGIGWFVLHIPYWIFWLFAIIYLASLIQSTRSIGLSIDKPAAAINEWGSAVMLITLAGMAILVTLIANHPDPDDTFYLNSVIATLDHPNLPMLSFDGMHGDTNAPLLEVYYKPQTEIILQALIAKATGISATAIYYIVFPICFAVFIVIAHWLFVRSFDTGAAWLGLLVVFLLLLAWGESHRAYGNFSFVRLYQGKSELIFVFTPLIVYYARLFLHAPSRRNWLLLMFAQIGAVAFSSSALITAPITAGITVFSLARPARESVRRVLKGLLASAPVVLILILVYLEKRGFAGAAAIDTSGVSREVLNFTGMLSGRGKVSNGMFDFTTTFGNSWRAPIALFALLALPLAAHAARLASAAWVTRFVFLICALLLNNITGPFVAEHASRNFAWRLYWAVPAPALVAVALTVGVVLAIRLWSFKNKQFLGAMILSISAAALFSFLAAGKWTLSPGNQVTFQWATPKVNVLQYRIAQYVVRNTPKGSTALVIYPIASYVTRFHNAPALIAARRLYMESFRRYWGEKEFRQRLLLAGYVSGNIGSAVDIGKITPWVLNQIDRRGIKCIVTFNKLSNYPPLHQGLIKMGFVPRQAPPYVVWLRS
jgi:hypothetical protein